MASVAFRVAFRLGPEFPLRSSIAPRFYPQWTGKFPASSGKSAPLKPEKWRGLAPRPVICRCLISAPGMPSRAFQNFEVHQTSVSSALAMCENRRALKKARRAAVPKFARQFGFSGSMQHFSGERAYFPDQCGHVNQLKRCDILSGPRRNAT